MNLIVIVCCTSLHLVTYWYNTMTTLQILESARSLTVTLTHQLLGYL